MKTYTVYRLNLLNKTMVPVGTLIERRQKERAHNEAGILKLAQKLYAESSTDKLHIVVNPE